MRILKRVSALIGVVAVFAVPGSAAAYIGPGAGISAIGTVIALIGAVVFAVVGFVWYPVKRLRAQLRRKNSEKSVSAS